MHTALRRGPPRVIWAMLTGVLALLLVPGCDSAPAAEAGNPVAATGRPVVGSLAPDFTLTDLDGNSVRLADFRGQAVFLNFWATWCPPCRAEMPDIEALHRKYRDRGVVVLGVDLRESESTVRTYLERGGYTWTFLIDTTGRVASAYRVSAIPTSFFIDREGVIRAVVIGGMTASTMEARLALAMQ